MNSGLRGKLACGLLLAVAAGAQVPGNSSLAGRYFARHIQFTTDATNKVTDARSITGVITFTGAGAYTFTGQQVILTGAPASFSVTGSYAVASSGVVTMTNPQRTSVDINARFSAEAVTGSSTDVSDSSYDLLVAIPAPGQANLTAASVSGSYYATDFELTGAATSQVRNSWFAITADGGGNLGAISVRGHSVNSNAGGVMVQNVTGATYTMGGDGTGTITLPTPAGQTAQGALLGAAQRTLYVSGTGNMVLAATPGGHDMLVGVKAYSGAATNASVAAGAWLTGIRVDSAGSAAAFTGSMRTTANSLVRSRRLHETGSATPVNETSALPFSLAADGTGSAGAAKVGLGTGGALMTFANVNSLLDPTGYEVSVLVAQPSLNGTGVFVNPLGVVNAASGAPGVDSIAPGEFISIYGSGLATSTLAAAAPYPQSVNGVSVTIGGIPAPVQLVSANQINCLVPYGVSGKSVAILVNNKGAVSNTVSIPLAATAPGIFTLDSTGTNDAAVLHLDATVVNSASPAKKGEVVAMYLTGLGALTSPVPDGQGATAADSAKTQLQLLVNGVVVQPSYAGLSSLAGLYQINFQIPATLDVSGLIPVAVLTPDAFHDQVSIAVQ